jgi:hypothetical protein
VRTALVVAGSDSRGRKSVLFIEGLIVNDGAEDVRRW